jgi:hypothetical protein
MWTIVSSSKLGFARQIHNNAGWAAIATIALHLFLIGNINIPVTSYVSALATICIWRANASLRAEYYHYIICVQEARTLKLVIVHIHGGRM